MTSADKLFRFLSSGAAVEIFERELEKALTPQDIIAQLAEHYRFIMKKLNAAPARVKLDPSDLSILILDGVVYDLDTAFSRRDGKIRECRMAIESLMADLSSQGYDISSVEQALNS